MNLFAALIFLFIFSVQAHGQMVPFAFSSAQASPYFVQEVETAWNTGGTKVTSSFNVKAGDVLVAYSGMENGAGTAITISGGSLTWTLRQSVHIDVARSTSYIWTATVDTDKSMTVTFTQGSAVKNFGGNVLTFRRSSGVGASSSTDNLNGAPSVNITTTKANSAIVVFSSDWNAADGASRTWRTNAGALTETSYFTDLSTYTIYGGYHANAGPIGTYAVGLTTPSNLNFTIVAVEIKGP